jgi:hypothetical protein
VKVIAVYMVYALIMALGSGIAPDNDIWLICSHPATALVFVMQMEALFIAGLILFANVLVVYKREVEQQAGQNSHMATITSNMEAVKERIARLNREAYLTTAALDHIEVVKEDTIVGKGYYKMHWLLEQGFSPQGRVLELGRGAGSLRNR